MIYNNVHVMGINALIFWMPVQNWHGTYLHHRDTVKCLKKYILFEYLVNAIIALLWGIIAWRFLLLAKQTPTFSLLSWVSYYSFKLLKMNALKVDLWPCFLSLSLWFSFGKWVGEKFSWISVHTEPKSTSIFTKSSTLIFHLVRVQILIFALLRVKILILTLGEGVDWKISDF